MGNVLSKAFKNSPPFNRYLHHYYAINILMFLLSIIRRTQARLLHIKGRNVNFLLLNMFEGCMVAD